MFAQTGSDFINMYRTSLSHLMCLIIIFSTVFPVQAESIIKPENLSQSQISQIYPDAKIIYTEAENYSDIAEELSNQGYISQAQSVPDNAGETYQRSLIDKPELSTEDCNKTRNHDSTTEESLDIFVNVTGDIIEHGEKSGSGDQAAIVFVVIGTVLVVVWALYVFKYLYDITTGFKPCHIWYEFNYTSSRTHSSGDQRLEFNGLRFMTGFRDRITEVGFAVELGKADIKLTEINSLELNGNYWLLGPILRWPLSENKNPGSFYMNFMAGSTEHDDINYIAKANIGLRFALAENFTFSINWGVLNIDLSDSQSLINDRDQYHYIYGINTGLLF